MKKLACLILSLALLTTSYVAYGQSSGGGGGGSSTTHTAMDITLYPGWNVVSTPFILSSVSFSNNGNGINFSKLQNGQWVDVPVNTTNIKPLEGYMVYNNNSENVTLTLTRKNNVSPTEATLQKNLNYGWDLLGITTINSPFYNVPGATMSLDFTKRGTDNLKNKVNSDYTWNSTSSNISSPELGEAYGVFINQQNAVYGGVNGGGSNGGNGGESTNKIDGVLDVYMGTNGSMDGDPVYIPLGYEDRTIPINIQTTVGTAEGLVLNSITLAIDDLASTANAYDIESVWLGGEMKYSGLDGIKTDIQPLNQDGTVTLTFRNDVNIKRGESNSFRVWVKTKSTAVVGAQFDFIITDIDTNIYTVNNHASEKVEGVPRRGKVYVIKEFSCDDPGIFTLGFCDSSLENYMNYCPARYIQKCNYVRPELELERNGNTNLQILKGETRDIGYILFKKKTSTDADFHIDYLTFINEGTATNSDITSMYIANENKERVSDIKTFSGNEVTFRMDQYNQYVTSSPYYIVVTASDDATPGRTIKLKLDSTPNGNVRGDPTNTVIGDNTYRIVSSELDNTLSDITLYKNTRGYDSDNLDQSIFYGDTLQNIVIASGKTSADRKITFTVKDEISTSNISSMTLKVGNRGYNGNKGTSGGKTIYTFTDVVIHDDEDYVFYITLPDDSLSPYLNGNLEFSIVNDQIPGFSFRKITVKNNHLWSVVEKNSPDFVTVNKYEKASEVIYDGIINFEDALTIDKLSLYFYNNVGDQWHDQRFFHIYFNDTEVFNSDFPGGYEPNITGYRINKGENLHLKIIEDILITDEYHDDHLSFSLNAEGQTDYGIRYRLNATAASINLETSNKNSLVKDTTYAKNSCYIGGHRYNNCDENNKIIIFSGSYSATSDITLKSFSINHLEGLNLDNLSFNFYLYIDDNLVDTYDMDDINVSQVLSDISITSTESSIKLLAEPVTFNDSYRFLGTITFGREKQNGTSGKDSASTEIAQSTNPN